MLLNSVATFLPPCMAIINSIPSPINTHWELKLSRRTSEKPRKLSLNDLVSFPHHYNHSLDNKLKLSSQSINLNKLLCKVGQYQLKNKKREIEEDENQLLLSSAYSPLTGHYTFLARNFNSLNAIYKSTQNPSVTTSDIFSNQSRSQEGSKFSKFSLKYPTHIAEPKRTQNLPKNTKKETVEEAQISPFLLLSSIHPSHINNTQISFCFDRNNLLNYLYVAYQTAYTAYKGSYILLASFPLFFIFGLQSISPTNHSLNQYLEQHFWDYFFWFSQLAGPTFIKFLQWAATRVDLLPLETCKRFARFHYFGMLHSYNMTVLQLRLAFGENWRDWLAFDPKPIGSGCIAQVYKGYIIKKDGTKEEVAIKVAHPNIKSIMENDFFILKSFANLCSYLPMFEWINIKDSVDQFCSTMEKQLDLNIEAENMQKFGQNFKNLDEIISKKRGSVRFPKPYLNYCTSNVLISSFEGGGLHIGEWMKLYHSEENSIHTHVSDHELNLFEKFRKNIGFTGMMAFLKMLFVDNFVHLDLHPGNIILRFPKDRNVDFELVFLDCGLTTSMKRSEQKNLFDLFYAIFQNNGIEAGNLLLSRSHRQECTNGEEFAKEIEHLINTLNSKDQGGFLKSKRLFFGEILYKMMKLSNQYRVELDTNFVSIICALLVLDGVGHQLDTTFNVLDAALPFRSLINKLN